MNLKVTIEKDGTPFTKEFTVGETFAPLLVVGAIQEVLNKADLMEKGETLQVLGSDESALLSYSGY